MIGGVMPHPVPTRRVTQIVAAGRALLEAEGPEALSMRNVARRIGIRAPSLYEHVADKRALEDAIIAAGMSEQGAAVGAAIAGVEDPLWAAAMAWRTWAQEHPHLYRMIFARGLNRDDPAVLRAEIAAGDPIRALTKGDLGAARVIWAFAHGMVMLELNERFPPGYELDELWQRGIETLRTLIEGSGD
jgi:AcrR family transcriptional regulator